MIKFDKDEFLNPQIYSTNDKYETRSRVSKEVIKDIEKLQQRIDKVLQIIKECKMLMSYEVDLEEQVNNISSILQDEEVEDNV